jgi:hypothetical protein
MGRNEKQFVPAQSANSKGMLDFTPAYVVPNFGGKVSFALWNRIE